MLFVRQSCRAPPEPGQFGAETLGAPALGARTFGAQSLGVQALGAEAFAIPVFAPRRRRGDAPVRLVGDDLPQDFMRPGQFMGWGALIHMGVVQHQVLDISRVRHRAHSALAASAKRLRSPKP